VGVRGVGEPDPRERRALMCRRSLALVADEFWPTPAAFRVMENADGSDGTSLGDLEGPTLVRADRDPVD